MSGSTQIRTRKRTKLREKLIPVLSNLRGVCGRRWLLSTFITAGIGLCRSGWKNFCTRESFLCLLRGLRILDYPIVTDLTNVVPSFSSPLSPTLLCPPPQCPLGRLSFSFPSMPRSFIFFFCYAAAIAGVVLAGNLLGVSSVSRKMSRVYEG